MTARLAMNTFRRSRNGNGPRLSEPQHSSSEPGLRSNRMSQCCRTRCGSENRGPVALVCAALLALLCATSLLADASLSVGSALGGAGSSVSVPLTLGGASNVVALQADVVFDATVLSSSATIAGPALGGQVFEHSAPTSGVRRILIYSSNNEPISAGVIANLDFAIAPGAPGEVTALLLTNVILAATNGSALPTATVPGLITIMAVDRPVVLVNGRFHPDNAAMETNFALIQIQSSLPGGHVYYTLDGAPPASGALYSGPFVLTEPALVRAIAFSASFALAAEADPVTVDVVTPPFITTPPQGRTVGSGAGVNLGVTAGGTSPLVYQWFQNGVAVPGGTGPTLSLSNIQPNQGGNYTVIIANAFGSITSAPALVVVFAPPSILAQPTNATVSVGGTATFSISALGPPPLEFQWRKNGANIAGAINSTFTITNVQFDDGATYTVLVASPGGTLVSDPAQLTVTVPSPPAGDNYASTNTLIGANGAATGTNNFATREPGEPLHAGKPGSNSVWYAWTAHAQGIATFRTTGSTFDTLLAIYTGTNVGNLTTVVSDEDSGGFLASKASFNTSSGVTYHIAIDGLNGQQGSFVLRWDLLVTDQVVPEITCPPASRTVQPGQDATFTVSATGPSLTYQWRFNGAPILNAPQASYTRANVQPADVGFYSVLVRSTAPQAVESAPATLEIGADPGLQSKDKPNDVAASCPGALRARAASSAGASSVAMGSIGYQVLVSSSTNNLIDCNTANCGGIPTGTRFLELQASANGTFILDTIGSASRTKLWVCRTGTNNLDLTRTYLTCDVDSAPDGRSLVQFQAEAGRGYQVWISRLDSTNGLLQLNWKLGLPPLIASLSSNRFAPEGGSIILSVAATNVVAAGVTHALSEPSYSWYFNGTRLLGTGATLPLTNLKATDAGDYVVVASNEVGTTSAVVRVEVFGAVERAVVNAGGITELFADATTAGCGGAPAIYQWRFNGAILVGETNRSLYLRGAQPAQAGQYSVTVSNCFGAFTYAAATVAVTVDVGFKAQLSPSGQVVLHWQATPGKHYRVEHRPSLDSTAWTPLQPDLTATSATLTIQDSIGSEPRFYRIVLLD